MLPYCIHDISYVLIFESKNEFFHGKVGNTEFVYCYSLLFIKLVGGIDPSHKTFAAFFQKM